ncbi:MAG: molybdopterin biosynthesis protein [Myxococcales bacterium]
MADKRVKTGGYLTTVPLEEALARFLPRVLGPMQSELVSVEHALGRVTANAVIARISSPHYHGAAMDGIAVRAADTVTASEARPLRLEEHRSYERVDTGDPMPGGFDAVVMIEEVDEPAPGIAEILKAALPRQHVRLVGEDVVAGEIVFPRGHKLRPFDLGALLGCGNESVEAVRKPVVGILPTGDEIVEPGSRLSPGDIIESNSRMLAAVVEEEGGQARRYPICKDQEKDLEAALETLVRECDVALVIAGSSAGRGDFTSKVLSKLGELLVHGVNIMPGKPVALGLARGKPVIGVPGYPVSAAVVADLFLRPVVAKLLGTLPAERPEVKAKLLRKVPSRLGHAEFVRVTLGRVRARLVAVPLGRGAGAITSLCRAHGLMRIPERREGFDAGTEVSVELLVPARQLEHTTLCVGSHDPALDVLGDLLAGRRPGSRLASASVGSLGGILAVAAGEAHLAGSHLLDPATGEYNLPDLARHAPQAELAVVTLAHRAQGLLVPKGNPKGLRAFEDLAREDVLFVNRQRGSGTRVLLDHELAKRGIASKQIKGYEREEFTHAAVAVAVLSGAADAGLGVLAAAKALGLDFVPVAEERYDLIVPVDLLADPRVEQVLELLGTVEFRQALRKLGGYDDRQTGRRVL